MACSRLIQLVRACSIFKNCASKLLIQILLKIKLCKLTIKYLIMLLHFTITYVLECIYIHYFCLVGTLYSPHLFPTLRLVVWNWPWWLHVHLETSKLYESFPFASSPDSLLLNSYQHTTEPKNKSIKRWKRSLWRKL